MDPIILFFILGLSAGILKSELRLPAQIYEFVSILLLLTIGMKGGIELAKQSPSSLIPDMLAVIAMGALLPLVAFPVLLYLGKFKRPDAASIAAHYGSVSVGTYAVAVAYYESKNISYEEHMPLLLVMLEIPAILVGILLARGLSRDTKWRSVGHEVFLGKGIVLLVGGLFIGWIAGPEGLITIEPLFFDLFKGILAIFLLEMGLIAAMQLGSLKKYGLFLIAFGILMPIFSSVVGSITGLLLGLSIGGAAMLATLAASASYIAVPAAMRISVPEANPTLSLTASLGITFTFNVIFGIPIYIEIANFIYGP
ncbi:MAG: sodium-dependent bicarbonate transport family permease [Gammaproteobacteria bacterium]|nr:sodium-dependent bicarbonate transport family permease [Gammaproteobacteria bacterium]